MKLEDIGELIKDSYQIRIGIAVLVPLILLLTYFEISIHGVLFGAMIAGLMGLPVLVIYGLVKGMNK
jgi:hypothetical protein